VSACHHGRPMTAPAIAVEGVRKGFRRPHERVHTLKERALHPFRRSAFDEFEAVSDVSFAVERGEFFGIVGRNGSGKSTLLKLIAGIYGVDSGEIWVDGRLSTFIELGVGFNPDLAARDNVILNGIMLGLTPTEARRRYERVIDFSELREFENLKLKNYSSGMHVRLAFSVMTQVDADVLLIDEVLAVGDAAFQQKCFDEFNRLRDAGKTIVLVTHDMGSVRRFADRAMLLERGRLVSIGEPDLIGSQYLEMNFNREQREAAGHTTTSTAPDRFGDGRALITEIWVEAPSGEAAATVPQGEELTVRMNLEFRAPMEHPCVGFSLDNDDHRVVFNANSVWVEEHTGVFALGDQATVTVRFHNLLAPGRYFLSPYVAARGSTLELADHRPRMASFVTSGARVTGGIVDLQHDFDVRPGRAAPHLAEAGT
jgi:ABC-type polysaccharide/polyol phosphate transport system ATPase subunit